MFRTEACFFCHELFPEAEWRDRFTLKVNDKEYNFHRAKQCFAKYYAEQKKRLSLLSATRG